MLKSSKQIGKFEQELIKPISDYFEDLGYSVSEHARLNVAWSNVISDIDILATMNDEVIIIEIKSKQDKFLRAFEQLEKVKGFANKVYIATNKKHANRKLSDWKDDAIGFIHINENEINVLKPAENILSLSRSNTLSQLKRKCLVRLARLLDVPAYLPKNEIEKRIRTHFDEKDLKIIAKKIALCEHNCSENCILESFLVTACNSLKTGKL